MTEQERILRILDMVRCARLCDETGESLIKSGASIAEAEIKIDELIADYHLKILHEFKTEELDFFTQGYIKVKEMDDFVGSIVGIYLNSVYGELTYTSEPSVNFIKVYRERHGYVVVDDTFLNRYKGEGKLIGSIIPKRLKKQRLKNHSAPSPNPFTEMLVHKGFFTTYIDSADYTLDKEIYRKKVVDKITECFTGNELVSEITYDEIVLQHMGRGDNIPAHSDSNVNDNYLFNTLSHGAERGTSRDLIFGQRTEESLVNFLKGSALKDKEAYYKLSDYTPDMTIHPTKDVLVFINSFNPLFCHEVKGLTKDTSVYTIVSNMRI